MWLQNTGILDKLFNRVLNPPFEIPLPTVRIDEPLNMDQLGTAAMVMAAGMIISSVVFLGELCCGSPEVVDSENDKEKSRKRIQRFDGTIRH